MKKMTAKIAMKFTTKFITKLTLLSLALFLFSFSNSFAFDAKKTFETNCAVCHNIQGSPKSAPNLKDITKRRSEKWILEFVKNPQAMIDSGDETAVKLFKQYGFAMPAQNLKSDEIKAIIKYIEAEGAKAPVVTKSKKKKPEDAAGLMPPDDHRFLYTLGVAVVILMLAGVVLDIVYDRKPWLKLFQKKILIGVGVGLFVAVMVAGLIVKEARDLGYSQGYQPNQPINFSHKIHAGINKIDCTYCHYAAEKSRHAGIPAASLCLNCHNVLKKDSPEIKKIYKAVKENKPVEWVKIHNLPDFVYFNHAQHYVAGQVDCQRCHGAVEKMDKVFQYAPLSMGWCIECHREEKVKAPGPFQGETVEKAGGLDCNRCHY